MAATDRIEPATWLPPFRFISVDWAKSSGKRSVHIADTARRTIRHEARKDWSLSNLLTLARRLTENGSPVLVGIDCALGVPASYWKLVQEQPRWHGVGGFLEWLQTVPALSEPFFREVADPASWSVERPFFKVPRKEEGGLRAFTDRVEDGLRRKVEARSAAKPLFVVSGIPGTVGSATRELWRELSLTLREDRDFAVWPFDGDLARLLADPGVVLAEMYPRLAYGAALSEALPAVA